MKSASQRTSARNPCDSCRRRHADSCVVKSEPTTCGVRTEGPEAWLIENIDLNLQLCGTPHRYFHPEFRFCFEEHEKTSVVIDVPSMLLTSPGKLCDDGTGRTVTRISSLIQLEIDGSWRQSRETVRPTNLSEIVGSEGSAFECQRGTRAQSDDRRRSGRNSESGENRGGNRSTVETNESSLCKRLS